MAGHAMQATDVCRGCEECRDFRPPDQRRSDPAGRKLPAVPVPVRCAACPRLAQPGSPWCLCCGQCVAHGLPLPTRRAVGA